MFIFFLVLSLILLLVGVVIILTVGYIGFLFILGVIAFWIIKILSKLIYSLVHKILESIMYTKEEKEEKKRLKTLDNHKTAWDKGGYAVQKERERRRRKSGSYFDADPNRQRNLMQNNPHETVPGQSAGQQYVPPVQPYAPNQPPVGANTGNPGNQLYPPQNDPQRRIDTNNDQFLNQR